MPIAMGLGQRCQLRRLKPGAEPASTSRHAPKRGAQHTEAAVIELGLSRTLTDAVLGSAGRAMLLSQCILMRVLHGRAFTRAMAALQRKHCLHR